MASGDVIHSIEEYERDLGAIKKKPSTLDRHEGKSWSFLSLIISAFIPIKRL